MDTGTGHPIHLSGRAMAIIRERMSQHGYASASEYLEALIAADSAQDDLVRQHTQDDIDRRTREALASGQGEVVDEAFWQRFRQLVADRAQRREKPAA